MPPMTPPILMPPPTADFSGNHASAPGGQNWKKEAMAAIIGVQWRHVKTIFTKFKLLNAISVQFVDCHVCIMIYFAGNYNI